MTLTRGEKRCLEFITRCDFTGSGCAITQAELACHLGYKRPYVNALVKSLRTKGCLQIEKRRHPGSPFDHNVYTVPNWNPNVRRGICNLRREWQRIQARSDTKRTAGTEEGAYAHDTSSSMSPFTRCQHAARASTTQTFRRSRVCERPECQQTASKLAKAGDELVGAYETIKAQGKELSRVKRQLSNETSPMAVEIRRVLDHWGEKHPKANTSPDGSRARVVRGAYKLGHTDPPLTCPIHDAAGKPAPDSVCTVADELIEALQGLALMPFVGPHGRCAEAGRGTRRFDGIEYALTDRKTGAPSEATIERFRAYARWAKLSSSEKLFAAYQRTGDVHEEYTRRFLDALARENRNGNGAHA